MRLLVSPTSPYVRKVRAMIREFGLQDSVEEVNVTTTPLASDPDVIAVNPTARIPVLIRDDGPPIHDSRVITRYLDDTSGAGAYPAGRLWEVLTRESLADAILDSALVMTYEARFRPEALRWPEWSDAHWAKICRAVAVLDSEDLSRPDDRADMGQIAVACALGYLDFRHDSRNWRAQAGRLADWYETFAARPAMAATRPPAA